MANFPNSVFAPASRTAGQTIQPAHVNDLQDEVAAIEAGYINGTAPLHASSVTVSGGATLNGLPYVFPSAGASTGATLTIDSTSGSTMTLKWAAPSAGTVPDAVRLQLDAAAQFAAGNNVVNWTNQVFMTNSSLHSTAVNSSRITPQSTGIYLVTAQVRFGSTAATSYEMEILDSSAGTIAKDASSGSFSLLHASGLKRFDATGGWVYVNVFTGGSTNSFAANDNTFISLVKL